MKTYLFGLLAVIFGVFFVAPSFASAELAGTTWTAVSFNGTDVEFEGSLEFDDTMMYSKFCNNVSQGYIYADDTLTASGAGVSTMMYCEGLPMDMEMAFQLFTDYATPVMMSGEMLTITASGDNVFVFVASDPVVCTMQYEPVCGEDGVTYGNACMAGGANATIAYEGECLPVDEEIDATCTEMFDGCNTCIRMSGEDEWACTKMYCETPTAAYCITHSEDVIFVGYDEDKYGCKASDGYIWSQSQQACVNEEADSSATSLEIAYDFAFNVGMTTMETLATFRADDLLTRQEAAKMFVALAVGVYDQDTNATSNLCSTPYIDENLFDYSLEPFIYAACDYEMMKGAQGYFMPNGLLTKGEALTVLMRTVDGFQTEPDTDMRWMPYVDRARELNLLQIDSVADFNTSISRAELVIWAHLITDASVNN